MAPECFHSAPSADASHMWQAARVHVVHACATGVQVVSWAWNHPDPMVPSLLICAAAIFVCWVWSWNGNCSHVDRLWSVLPMIYLAVFAWDDLVTALHIPLGQRQQQPQQPDPRLLLQLVLVCMWGARLTYNFARKGGYSLSYEDYRWEEVRKLFHPLVFKLFNLVFIAAAQNMLLLAILSPAYVAWLAKSRGGVPLGWLDAVAAALFITFYIGEIVADQQQWRFQEEKRQLIFGRKTRFGDHARGFLSRGLFRVSRHPAFFCEIMIWWSFHLFAIAASASSLNWTLIGPLGLMALFHGSTWITEVISSSKYPKYKQYKQMTSMLVPWFPKGYFTEGEDVAHPKQL